jgi:uncharacterized protein
MLRTILLLVFSNIFMTIAWYGHLRHQNVPLWKAIIVSWLIAFVEYCFMVPANRIGYQGGYNAFHLKMIQEVITLVIFSVFAIFYLKEPFHYRYIISFVLLMGAVYFMFKR